MRKLLRTGAAVRLVAADDRLDADLGAQLMPTAAETPMSAGIEYK